MGTKDSNLKRIFPFLALQSRQLNRSVVACVIARQFVHNGSHFANRRPRGLRVNATARPASAEHREEESVPFPGMDRRSVGKYVRRRRHSHLSRQVQAATADLRMRAEVLQAQQQQSISHLLTFAMVKTFVVIFIPIFVGEDFIFKHLVVDGWWWRVAASDF